MNWVLIINLVLGGILTIYLLMIVLEIMASWQQKRDLRSEKTMVLMVRVAKDNEAGPLVAEQVFSTIHSIVSELGLLDRLRGINPEKISFEIANIGRSIRFYVQFPARLRNLVEGQIYAQYPFVEIEEVPDYAIPQSVEVAKNIAQNDSNEGRDKQIVIHNSTENLEFNPINTFSTAVGAELALNNFDFFPIKQYGQYEDKSTKMNVDPLSAITATLAKFSDPDEQAWIQYVFSPVSEKRGKYLQKTYEAFAAMKKKFVRKWYFNFFVKSPKLKRIILFPVTWVMSPKRFKPAEDAVKDEKQMLPAKEKLSGLLFNVNIRIVYIPKEKNHAVSLVKLKEIAGSFKQFNMPDLNGFVLARVFKDSSIVERYRARVLENPFLLNVKEMATIFHLPNITVQTPNIFWVRSKKIEPPNDLPKATNDLEAPVTAIGTTNFRGVSMQFGIKTLDRRRHMYIIGKTGMGKSTLLENMIYADIQAGRGVAVVDPHGDLAETVLNFVPSRRTNDVIIVDPSDRDWPIAFNMLENIDPSLNTIVASGLVGIFKKIYADSWGPRLEHILRNVILSLLEYPNTTMLGIPRILQDSDFRRKVIRKIQDPLVKSFWLNEFEMMEPRQRIEAISPILNKVGQFLSSPIVRNILGQVNSKIDFRWAMDNKKIVVVNLSKGKIGEDNSSLLGAMIITKFQIDAMSRANIPEKDRVDFYLYVDEFQNFATDSFATILSEARKYKLNLTMANQYIAQMPEEVRDAVFGNVGTILSYQVGFDDAEYLSGQFAEEAMPNDLVNLSKFTAYMRLLIDGMPSKTFSLATNPPVQFEAEADRKEKVIRLARERYCSPRVVVEDKIMRWSKGIDVDEESNSAIAGPEEIKSLEEPKKKLAVNKNELLLKDKKDTPKAKTDLPAEAGD
jgi:hypothetical protein